MKLADFTKHFNLKRAAFLMRNKFLAELPLYGIGAGIILGLNVMPLFFKASTLFNSMGSGSWIFTITLCSLLLASSAFKEFHSGKAGTEAILLPASEEEKYFSTVMYYAFLFPLLAILTAFVMSFTLFGIDNLLRIRMVSLFNPLTLSFGQFYYPLFLSTLVMLSGSILFKKFAFVKTFGSLIAYTFAFSLFILCIVYFFIGDEASIIRKGFDFSFIDSRFKMHSGPSNELFGNIVQVLASILYYGVYPLLALFFGYFRLKEKEARDEVQ